MKRGEVLPDSKRSQIKLSFGMIFSIILIIIFISFAFYAIQKFLNIGNIAQIANFKDSFQEDVSKIWKGSQGSQKQEYLLPSKIKYICFIDYSSQESGKNRELYKELEFFYSGSEKLFFYPPESTSSLDSTEINHLDIEKTTQDENPFCIENIKGRIKLTISKKFGEALVTISR